MNRIKNTIFEMFEQRGYTDIEDNEENNYYEAITNDGKKICGVYLPFENLNTNTLNNCITLMKQNEYDQLLITYKDLTNNVLKMIEHARNLGLIIETFQELKLYVNITKHELVPKHEKVVDPDIIARVSKQKFSTLLVSDPVSRFYFFQKGDIIKVYRKDSITFKIVR